MDKINIEEYLKKNNYSQEEILDKDKMMYAKIYQKEIVPDKWNALVIFSTGVLSASSIFGLVYNKIKIPDTEKDLKSILLKIECHDKSK